eukprot:1159472-Pelagomonas_calceolata.AAC.14
MARFWSAYSIRCFICSTARRAGVNEEILQQGMSSSVKGGAPVVTSICINRQIHQHEMRRFFKRNNKSSGRGNARAPPAAALSLV